MFHVEEVILNSEDHQILVVQERKKVFTEVIKNEIDFIDVSELGEFPKFSTSNLSCQVIQMLVSETAVEVLEVC